LAAVKRSVEQTVIITRTDIGHSKVVAAVTLELLSISKQTKLVAKKPKMKFCSAILFSVLLPLCQRSEAFSPHHLSRAPPTALFQGPRSSRIEGNQREPTDNEKQLMDEMITKLADAKPYELPNAVRRAFRVVSSPQFFMRIAELGDKADGEQKEKLTALASNLVATLEVVVETTEETLDERAKEVETVLKAAAEPGTGDFLVPLLPEQVQAMRKEVEGLEPSSLDEGFLSTVDAFMNKSHQDGMVRLYMCTSNYCICFEYFLVYFDSRLSTMIQLSLFLKHFLLKSPTQWIKSLS
jgi:hypothetical protein